MKKIILIHLFLISFYCKGQDSLSQSKEFEKRVYQINAEDKEMNDAIEMARKTFFKFEKALKSNNSNFKNFTLKKAYKSDKGDEHLFLYPIEFSPEKQKYVGIIKSHPIHTKEVKFDDIVEVDKKEISDWIYFDENNILKGGFTIRLLRSRMSELEKIMFDEESGFKYE